MKTTLQKTLKKIAGVLLIILGVAGLFLPFLQGIILISLGVVLLGNKKLLDAFNRFKRRFTKKRS